MDKCTCFTSTSTPLALVVFLLNLSLFVGRNRGSSMILSAFISCLLMLYIFPCLLLFFLWCELSVHILCPESCFLNHPLRKLWAERWHLGFYEAFSLVVGLSQMAAPGEVLLVRLGGRKLREDLFEANPLGIEDFLAWWKNLEQPPFDDISSFNRYLLGLLLCKWKSKYPIILCCKCDTNGQENIMRKGCVLRRLTQSAESFWGNGA